MRKITFIFLWLLAINSMSQGDNCSDAINLCDYTTSGSGTFSSTTTGKVNDFTAFCSMNSSEDMLFYVDLPAGETINIGQTANTYDSRHTLRYGAIDGSDCPGSTEVTCVDDPEFNIISWTNSTGSIQRVYWVQAGWSTSDGGFDLAWSFSTDPCGPPPPMTYNSTTTVQTNSNVIVPGQTDREIIGINVNTSGSVSPFDLTQIQFNMNGTTSLTDVTGISIYYTGGSSVFSATGLFGTAASSAGTITVNGSQTLSDGDNYFWIAYNVSAGATLLNFVDTECTQVTLTTEGNKIPSPTAPAGNRQIDNLPPTYSKRIGNLTAGTSFWARAVIEDGAYHVFAASGSETGKTAGGSDMCLIKVDANGNPVLTKSYGTANGDIPYDIIKTSDGGYVIVGQSNFDYAVFIKVASDGTLLWRNFVEHGDLNSAAYSVIENSSGDLIAVGKGESSYTDMYMWRLDMNTGAILNSKNIWWSAMTSEANDVIQTSDGGYLLAGVAGSDFALMKLTSAFAMSWRMKWGSGSTDELETVIENGANDYSVFGVTYGLGPNSSNGYAMRFNSSTSTVIWENAYDGGSGERFAKVITSGDGGYIASGLGSILGDPFDNEGVVVKINSAGDIVWDHYIGIDDYETYCIASAGGSSYVAGGLVNAGNTFMHYLKIDANGYNCNDQGSGFTATAVSPAKSLSTSVGVNNAFTTNASAPAISEGSGFSGDVICETTVNLRVDENGVDVLCDGEKMTLKINSRDEVESIKIFGSLNGSDFEAIKESLINRSDLAVEVSLEYEFYYYELHYLNGIVNKSKIFTSDCGEKLTNSVVVYPQPFQNQFNMHFGNVVDNARVMVYDSFGKLLVDDFIENSQSHSIDMLNYSSGIYFVKVFSEGVSTTKKIIKK